MLPAIRTNMDNESSFIPTPPTPYEPPKNLEWPAATPSPSQPRTPVWAIAATVVLVGTLAIIFVVASQRKPAPIVTEVASPTPTPSPTPVRTPSILATQSAFLNLQASVSSLSALLDAADQDSTLTPPVVDLKLDLGKQ